MRNHCPHNPPDDALEALDRCLFPAMRAYFESEEGKHEFEQWKSCQGIKQCPENIGGDSSHVA